ncbi:ABC transporter substrate-binding protein [Sedimentitalea sp. HM32M-2]|uniref:ABC transporter substrate-binding protein n=1 Tax=Sedimentitalea sp. HM32M-2 TaxID=3351566 RepID=UPI003645A73C
MRNLVLLIAWCWAAMAGATEWEERQVFAGSGDGPTLRVISSTDIAVFAPIIDSFLAGNPGVSIEYLVTGSTATDTVFRAAPDRFDLVISSAMDLQLKLVNDGFAQQVPDIVHPDWAQWRHSLFGFTREPAAIVINKAAFQTLPIPRSRQQLIEVLRANPELFRGRLGTYDVRESGLGYLFATQDARASETYWRLTEVMGGLGSRLYCCSGDMIRDLVRGDIAVAYNVLASYASARADAADDIAVILPSDFPTTMMRTAFVAKAAPNPEPAKAFLRHLTSSRWQTAGASGGPLPALTTAANKSQFATITLEPGLMTYLDRLKRQTFIMEWESAIIQ